MKKEGAKSFLMYYNLAEPLEMLTMRERGELITAIFAHEVGVPAMPPKLSPKVRLLFGLIADLLDRNCEAYAEKCARNAENGRRGGRPSKKNKVETVSETERFSKKAKKADKDMDKEIDMEREKDIDMEIDMGKEREIGIESRATEGSGEFSTPPSENAVPPAAQLIRSHEERVRIFREIPKDYIRSRLDRAEAYAEERDMSISDVLLNWWLYDREAVEA